MHGLEYPDTFKRGLWGDHPCNQKLSAVCQVPAQYTLHISKEAKEFAVARYDCEMQAGMLATVHSLAENRRVAAACDSQRCWLGLNDRLREGSFQWADGTMLVAGAGGFTNWVPGEPDDTKYAAGLDEDCVYMHGSKYPVKTKVGQWGDHPCNEKMLFVCQVPIDRPTPSPVFVPPPNHNQISGGAIRPTAAAATPAATWSTPGTPQSPTASASTGGGFFSRIFWLAVYCGVGALVLYGLVQGGYIQERKLYTTRRQLQDKVYEILDSAGMSGGTADQQYGLMSDEDDQMGPPSNPPPVMAGIPRHSHPQTGAANHNGMPASGGYEAPSVPGVYCA
jgi:hypothetical protein